LYYYKTLLLKSSAPSLTYYSQNSLTIGSVVSVPLKTTVKEAVVVAEVEKPEFEAAQIVSVSDRCLSHFISECML